MINMKYEVWMNDIALSGLSDFIYVSGIEHKPAALKLVTSETAGRNGEQVKSGKMKGTSVTVSFYLKKTDPLIRQQIVQSVAAWARDGVLKTADRPGQRLHVLCTEFPRVPDVCDWTTPVKITFQAFERPFWEEIAVVSATLTGSGGSGTLFVPGNAGKTTVEATITPDSSLDSITLTAGDTSLSLAGISATSSSPVTISYDENGYLKIMRGTTSLMDKRTGSDDLLAECGRRNTIGFTASAAASVTFRARGLWL